MKNTFDPTQYTIYSFELFCHGKSTISNPLLLTKRTLSDLIRTVVDKHNIINFELCAYSLGAKYALALLFEQEELITKVHLIAPDGFIKKKSYSFATANNFTTWLFEFVIGQANWLIHIPKLLARINLIPSNTVEFVEKQLSNSGRKDILVDIWLSVKNLSYPKKELIKKLTSSTHINFYVGKLDPVISAKKINSISNQISNATCTALNDNHSRVRFTALEMILNS